MWRQIKILTDLELCNLYGINVFRYNKDAKAKKKSMAMAAVYGLLLIMVIGYVCALCYGLVKLGAGEIIPAYLITIASILILMFSIFKAGGLLFRRQGYDMLAAMPVSKEAIVVSRFLRLYVENALLMLLVMLPGMIMYGIFERPEFRFYLLGIFTAFVAPLLPVALACGIGALITGVASRMRHKALAEAGLSMLLVVGALLATAKLPATEEEFTLELLKSITDVATEMIGSIYPPAVWLGEAMVQGSFGKFGLVAAGYILVFTGVVVLVAVNFHGICRKLYSTSAKHDYKQEQLQESSLMKALILREARRYFASGVYVSNTIIGPILAVALSVSLFFVDVQKLAVGLPISINVEIAVPFAIGMVFSMMNATCVSISMEGKTVWILKSLPLSRKQILDSKLLFNLLLFAPFYGLSVFLSILALESDMLLTLELVCVPAIICVFSCVFGIAANLMVPKLSWESEVEVVKQSASALVGMGGALLTFICMAVVLVLPKNMQHIGVWGICGLLVIGTVVLYRRNNRVVCG